MTEGLSAQDRDTLTKLLMGKAETLARSLSEVQKEERELENKIEALSDALSQAHQVEKDLQDKIRSLESSKAIRWSRKIRRVLSLS